MALPVDTPPEGAEDTHALPLLVSTFPVVPTAVNPVPPFAAGKVPVTPVVKGKPVQEVNVPLCGVPKTGVVNDGEVARATTVPEPVVV